MCNSASESPSYFDHSEYCTVVIDCLISLKGYQFLNEGGDLQSSYDWESLTSSYLFFEAESGSKYDRLTPPRYVPYKSGFNTRPSDEELITLLLRNCHFKPKCLFFPSFLNTISELLLQSEPCDILMEFLNEVEEVQLIAPEKWPNLTVGLFQPMFSGISLCKLRTLHVHFEQTYSSQFMMSGDYQDEFELSLVRNITDVIKQHCFLETIYLDSRERCCIEFW